MRLEGVVPHFLTTHNEWNTKKKEKAVSFSQTGFHRSVGRDMSNWIQDSQD